DNGEAEVAGGGFPLPRLQNKVPEQVGPVIAPPTGLYAGSVVRSGGHTPPPNHNPNRAKKKKTKTQFLFKKITSPPIPKNFNKSGGRIK
ncbi:hypothetical protein ACVGV7_06205, partial [Enterobacter intestinihominis]